MNKHAKVISVYGSYLHGAGVSTMALSLAIVMQQITDKKVLVINLDNERSLLEKFIERDVEIKHSIDDIRIYEEKLKPEVIENHVDMINDNLFLISKSKTGKTSLKFVDKLIDIAKKKFDFIIIDTGNNPDDNLLRNADISIYVSEYNELTLDNTVKTIKDDKTVIVFNKFPNEYSSNLTTINFKKNHNIKNQVFTVNYDESVFTEACEKRNIYSFLIKNLNSKNIFINDIFKITVHAAEHSKVKVQKNYEKRGLIGGWNLKIF
ncbi:MAG TPA: hypothetical protein DEP72_05835 [Clostridiales bacterium]|nr:MAG: hypothetical protein A2Y18_06310 [Clostridiales bacterium GWD2_32_19]HCC07662.1 hypothetical protein [Clostridiales bacterium]